MWLWMLGGALIIVVYISVMQYRAASKTYVSLSQRQPAHRTAGLNPELGLEEIDMNEVRRTQRRNESLERAHTNWTQKRSATSAADTDIQPMADDETYSARYHAAFNEKKNKD